MEFSKSFFDKDIIDRLNQLSGKGDFNKLSFTMSAYILPKATISSFEYNFKDIQSEVYKLYDLIEYVHNKERINRSQIQKTLMTYLTDDFYGLLKGKTLEQKKLKTIEIYRYFFRFSIEKLYRFVNNTSFIIMILHYIRESRMIRLHQR